MAPAIIRKLLSDGCSLVNTRNSQWNGSMIIKSALFCFSLILGLVQKSSGQVAQAWAQRHERSRSRRPLQIIVQSAIQWTHATIRCRRCSLRRLRTSNVQFMGGQGTKSVGRHGQELPMGSQLSQHVTFDLGRHVRSRWHQFHQLDRMLQSCTRTNEHDAHGRHEQQSGHDITDRPVPLRGAFQSILPGAVPSTSISRRIGCHGWIELFASQEHRQTGNVQLGGIDLVCSRQPAFSSRPHSVPVRCRWPFPYLKTHQLYISHLRIV